MTRVRALVALVLVAVLTVLVAPAASAAPPVSPPWPDGSSGGYRIDVGGRIRTQTRWIPGPVLVDSPMFFALSEPAVNRDGRPSTEHFSLYWYAQRPPTDDGNESLNFSFRLFTVCMPASGIEYRRDSPFGSYQGGVAGGWQGSSNGGIWGANQTVNRCPSGDATVGIDVIGGIYTSGEGAPEDLVGAWRQSNAPRNPGPPTQKVCEALFGPPPWDGTEEATIDGWTYNPRGLGCVDPNEPGPDPGCSVNFECICADAPELEYYQVLSLTVWPTMDSLSAWIGHYAHCLFAPGDGFDTSPIGEAAEGGWIGASRGILASVAGSFGGGSAPGGAAARTGGGVPAGINTGVEWADEDQARDLLGDGLVDELTAGSVGVPLGPSGFGPASTSGCGNFVDELPIIGSGVSSCGLGNAWPDAWRTAAGAVVMMMAAFSTLFAIMRFMGVRYGWSTG